MLTGYSCKNFRAFRDASIEVRPLTIILGANGVGKTSLLQIPLLLQQTLNSTTKDYRSPLKIHGSNLSFGDAINIFHNQDSDNLCALSLDFVDEELRSTIADRLIAEYESYIEDFGDYLHFVTIRSDRKKKIKLDTADLEILTDYSDKRRQKPSNKIDFTESILSVIKTLEKSLDLSEWYNFRPAPFRLNAAFGRRRFKGSKVKFSDIRATYDFLRHISSYSSNDFKINFELRSQEVEKDVSTLGLCGLQLFMDGKLFIDLNRPENKTEIVLKSDIIETKQLEYINKDLADCISFDSTIFNVLKNEIGGVEGSQINHVRDIVLLILSKAISSIEKSFSPEMVSHVAPLRAYPKRYYFLDVAATGSTQGDNIVELLRENPELRAEVNEWLSKFDINVNVEQFREIIHRLTVKRDNLGFELDITDVGFGLSQVLPVITQSFLAHDSSLALIEQPEIHLHPNMQADLADLFISASRVGRDEISGPRLVVETHSEYLLNRLRRRIAEGKISSQDVAIYFVERGRNGDTSSTVRRVEIASGGAFEWPIEFFESTIEDTVEFLALQE